MKCEACGTTEGMINWAKCECGYAQRIPVANKPKAGYRQAVAWIALNDEPTVDDPEIMENLISTLLVADMFGKEEIEVAKDVVAYRKRHPNG